MTDEQTFRPRIDPETRLVLEVSAKALKIASKHSASYTRHSMRDAAEAIRDHLAKVDGGDDG